MDEIKKPKQYDLEDRTFAFAKRCRKFIETLHKTVAHAEDGKQLIRSSGSVAANYIEANESLSKKDFIYRVKICRKETKESRLWIRLCYTNNSISAENERLFLIKETEELAKIFGAILEKSK